MAVTASAGGADCLKSGAPAPWEAQGKWYKRPPAVPHSRASPCRPPRLGRPPAPHQPCRAGGPRRPEREGPQQIIPPPPPPPQPPSPTGSRCHMPPPPPARRRVRRGWRSPPHSGKWPCRCRRRMARPGPPARGCRPARAPPPPPPPSVGSGGGGAPAVGVRTPDPPGEGGQGADGAPVGGAHPARAGGGGDGRCRSGWVRRVAAR